ncbi:MAG: PD40 domain-containing protein [Candidatus Zixiibacteriota bacterium]|nr:MAG: PD40 domain-containing protein [candidate division Zixibacteria bacterium]
MKNLCILIVLTLLVSFAVGNAQEVAGETQSVPPVLTGDYLGQETPGVKPALFAPIAVSTNTYQERDVTFTPDLNEFYFTRDAVIQVMKQQDGVWSPPQPVSFSSEYREFEAFVTPDGQRLYYISQRPVDSAAEPNFYQMWYVERSDSDWGEPTMLNDRRDFYPTVTTYNVMYFTDANNDLYRTVIVDGAMSIREKLSDSVNTQSAEYNSCISPDESYIIFTSFGWGYGFGGGDLYISFRNEDGSWTRAKNMGGGINTNGHDYCPAISPDGKYLFYTSNKNGTEDIYWVDIGIVDKLRSDDLNTSDMLFNVVMLNDSEVGRFKYGQLQEQFDKWCVFDGRLLVAVGDRLMNAGRSDDAVALMRLGAELHPETLTIAQRLKLAVLDGDDALFDDVARQLRENAASLGGRQEIQINGLGYRLMGWRRLKDALRVFKLNIEVFPESFNVYDSYGEALLLDGDTTGAVENYQRSLELNPNNTNAENVIERVRGE